MSLIYMVSGMFYRGIVHYILFCVDLGFASENVLEEYVTIYEDVFGAIVFGKSDWDNLPKDISYTIRLRSYKRTSGSDNGERIEWKTNDMTDAAYRRKEGPRDDIGPGRFIHRRELFRPIYPLSYLQIRQAETTKLRRTLQNLPAMGSY